MTNQEFQDILASLPAGFNVIINSTPFFDVMGSFETREGAIKGTIHITDTFAAKFNKTTGISFIEGKEKAKSTVEAAGKTGKEKRRKIAVKHDTCTPNANSVRNDEAVIVDIKSGLSYKELKKKYGIKPITYARLKRIGNERNDIFAEETNIKNKSSENNLKEHRAFLKQNRERIIADIAEGMSANECFKKWGISRFSYGQYKRGKNIKLGGDIKDSGRPMTQEERQAWLDEMNGVKKNNCGSSHAELL